MAYSPDRGDIVWLDFTPQAGREQSKRRPALVLSPGEYNRRVGIAIVCPITSKVKGYPFEVALPDNSEASGVVLADQIKSLDWRVRKAADLCKASSQTLIEVAAKVRALLPSV